VTALIYDGSGMLALENQHKGCSITSVINQVSRVRNDVLLWVIIIGWHH